MSDLRWLSISKGDEGHAAEIICVTPKGSIRGILLTVEELSKLTQQAAKLLDIAVRDLERLRSPALPGGLAADTGPEGDV